ncbi:MAG: phospho-N-acetylmuramoyl-pentapeptide-transferase [Lachnospiraceae bacterium]|nr:phospho-N-acetylmuramoyl-pentapeptide-transferase [Lachnospiraceae bacterium]
MNKWPFFALLISFALSALFGPVMIPFLHKLKFGQTIREDGPQSHLQKNGTPTMGGVIFLIPMIITSLLYMKQYPLVVPVVLMTVAFALIGFVDDFVKVVLKRSMGLTAMQKMAMEIVATAVFVYYMMNNDSVDLGLRIPFTGGKVVYLGIFAVVILVIAVLGTVNGANFTDGLDGLASSVTSVIAVFFSLVSMELNSGISPACLAMLGGLLGFLLYNVYPAKVFMGDTGSLALGGFVVACAYMTRTPLFLILVALIYLVEVLSVILQVGYFKITKGKRIFKMAPIHHHFELCGWSETRVVAVFTIVTVLICAIAFIGL